MRGAERKRRVMRKKLLITDKADGRAAALPRLPEKSHSLCEQVEENEDQLTIKKDTGSHRAAGGRKKNKDCSLIETPTIFICSLKPKPFYIS